MRLIGRRSPPWDSEEADVPWVLCQLAGTAWQLGDLALAEEEAGEAVRTASLTGGHVFRAFGLAVRAWVRATRGDLENARADAEEARAISERIAWRNGVNQASCALGLVAMFEGRYDAAVEWFAPTIAQIETLMSTNGRWPWRCPMPSRRSPSPAGWSMPGA